MAMGPSFGAIHFNRASMPQPKGMVMCRTLEKLSKKPVLKWEPFSTCFYPWVADWPPELRELYSCGEWTVLLYSESRTSFDPSKLHSKRGLPSDSSVLIGRVSGPREWFWFKYILAYSSVSS